MDIGGTKISAGIVSKKGRIISRIKLRTPKEASGKEFLGFVEDVIRNLLMDNRMKAGNVAAIGIGMPGVIDTKKGKVLAIGNLPLKGLVLSSVIKRNTKIKTFLGNDANLAVLGEKWKGEGRKARSIVNLSIGTGVGGGIILNNDLIAGSFFSAGEIGHMTIKIDGPKCTCGKYGCLEALAGRWAIEKSIRTAVKNGEKTVIADDISNKKKQIKSRILKKALEKHDPLVTKIMKDASNALGAAAVSIIHILDPEYIIFGGGVIEACGEFMMPIIQKRVKSDPFLSSISKCKIKRSTLGDDAIILGSVYLAMKESGAV
jgi:glucokinase